jgi:hypothetical protein
VVIDDQSLRSKGNFAQLDTNCDAAVVMIRHQKCTRIGLSVLNSAVCNPALLDGDNSRS